ncbi:MAG: hypothetical protein U0W24_11485 [Bacteroidales bacterium]
MAIVYKYISFIFNTVIKNRAILAVYILAITDVCAQNKFHQAGSSYFLFSMGSSHISVTDKNSSGQYQKREVTGSSYAMDFKFGNAVADNLIIHFDMILISSINVKVNEDGKNLLMMPSDYIISIGLFGMGATQYYRKNYFLSGTLGTGYFSVTENYQTIDSEMGFSMFFKAGKEMWLGKKWGVGLCLYTNYTYSGYENGNFSGTAIGLAINFSKTYFPKRNNCWGGNYF